ncbi:hypothetical protein [Herbaspirillum sp. ST 5-3]|uniref:hypothetical protein n=1 Tax=Oxalobacteraceae TaxID=75682 RepID=UPI0010A4BF5D|nr:hypothetical protein [Herbaspirillum sp. ST 5-3]
MQELASSNGVQTKYLGSWSSCTAQANGQFIRNNISFSLSGTDLLFTPAIGIVGAFSDAACTQSIPGQSAGVTPIVPLRIGLIKAISIAQQSNSRFSGNADELPDIGQADFKFAGFNSANTSIWFSPTSTFSGTVIRYDKN